MRPTPDVLVVGDALLDVYVAPSEPPRRGADVPAAIRVGPGGQGANLAVRLARRGVHVRLACALGDDASGRLVREALEVEGIEVDAIKAPASGAVVILVDGDGERTMLSRRVPLLPRSLEPAAWTLVSGYLLLEDGELEIPRGGRRAVVGSALPAGSESRWRTRVADLQPALVVLNADELTALGADDARLAREWGATLVVTGRDEVTVAGPNPGDIPHRVAVSRVPAVDTTGAGDAFAAAFLAELLASPDLSGDELDRAVAAGLALAAEVAAVPGAQAAVPLERRTVATR